MLSCCRTVSYYLQPQPDACAAALQLCLQLAPGLLAGGRGDLWAMKVETSIWVMQCLALERG